MSTCAKVLLKKPERSPYQKLDNGNFYVVKLIEKEARTLYLKNDGGHVVVGMKNEAEGAFNIMADAIGRIGESQTLVWDNILVQDLGDFVFLPKAVQEKCHLLVLLKCS